MYLFAKAKTATQFIVRSKLTFNFAKNRIELKIGIGSKYTKYTLNIKIT